MKNAVHVTEGVEAAPAVDTVAAAAAQVEPVSFLHLFQFATPLDYVLMVFGSIASLALGALQPAQMAIFGDVIDTVGGSALSPAGSESVAADLQAPILNFLFLACGCFGSGFIATFCWRATGERQAAIYRKQYLKAIMRQDVGWHDARATTGLASTFAEATQLVETGLGTKLSEGLRFVGQFLGGVGVAFYFQWDLALVLLAISPLSIIAAAFLNRVNGQVDRNVQEAFGSAGAACAEVLGAIRTVASFGAERREHARFEGLLAPAERVGIAAGWKRGLAQGMLSATGNLTISAGIVYGAQKIAAEREATNCLASGSCQVSGGAVLLTMFALNQGAQALGFVGQALSAISKARAAAGRMRETMERTPVIDTFETRGALIEPDALHGRVRFEHVAFRYPSRPDVRIYDDFSLTIEPGTTCALVGGSGSGKSTAVALLERFYDPDAGRVLLDGVDLRALQLRWLRQHIGLVGQEPTLFDGTIAQNIAYGRPDASRAEIEEAARKANAHTFVERFPDGFETRVGAGQLSGGQKQRIAIARAILKRPTILILDEATSALDNESERVVQAALDALLAEQKRTTVVIAHRLSTIRNADKIVVVGQGRVLEEGTHEALLAIGDGGHYHNLIAKAGGSATAAVGAQPAAPRADEPPSRADEPPAPPAPRPNEPADAAHVTIAVPPAAAADKPPKQVDDHGEAESAKAQKAARAAAAKAQRARIWEMQQPERGYLYLAIFGAVGLGSTMPVVGVLFMRLIRTFFFPDPDVVRMQAWMWAGIMVGISVAQVLLELARSWGLGVASERLTRRLRAATFASMLRQEMAWFDQGANSAANLSANLSRDVTLVAAVTGESLGIQLANTCTVVVGLGLIFGLGAWQLGLVALAVVPIVGAAIAVEFMTMMGADDSVAAQEAKSAGVAGAEVAEPTADDRRKAEAAARKQQAGAARSHASKVVGQLASSVRTVASFGLEQQLFDEYAAAIDTACDARIRGAWIPAFTTGMSQFSIIAAVAALYALGGYLISIGEADFESMFVVIMVMFLMAVGLGQFAQGATDQTKAAQAVSRILGVMDRESPLDPEAVAGRTPDGRAMFGRVRFEHVAFRYPSRPEARIYDDFDLTIEAGTTCALVGGSGSGKSTVVQLLERFYDPDAGRVLLDGVDLRALQLRWLRQHIGLVGQEPTLFDGTIAQNIAYGRPDASRAEIEEAARKANAHTFVGTFPNGFETRVGQGGSQLSGGQKQRIAIARAILKNPFILLLDEATSALDTDSERVVQAALDALLAEQKRTTIVIAHRLSTIRNADKIVVVGQGRVLEEGTHDALLAIGDGGHYSQLIKAKGE